MARQRFLYRQLLKFLQLVQWNPMALAAHGHPRRLSPSWLMQLLLHGMRSVQFFIGAVGFGMQEPARSNSLRNTHM